MKWVIKSVGMGFRSSFSNMIRMTRKSFMEIGSGMYLFFTSVPTVTQAILYLLGLFAPIKEVVYILVFFLFADLITSVYYQFIEKLKTNSSDFKGVSYKGKLYLGCKTLFYTFESGKFRRTFEKLVFYTLGLMVVFIFERKLLHINPTGLVSITNSAAILICAVEVTSICANISKITNNKIFNKIAQMINKKTKIKRNHARK